MPELDLAISILENYFKHPKFVEEFLHAQFQSPENISNALDPFNLNWACKNSFEESIAWAFGLVIMISSTYINKGTKLTPDPLVNRE